MLNSCKENTLSHSSKLNDRYKIGRIFEGSDTPVNGNWSHYIVFQDSNIILVVGYKSVGINHLGVGHIDGRDLFSLPHCDKDIGNWIYVFGFNYKNSGILIFKIKIKS